MFVLRNLFEELNSVLSTYGKSWDDVKFVAVKSDSPGELEIEIPKSDFEKIAKATYYNGTDGFIEIPTDLVVVGEGWHVEREIAEGGIERWRLVVHYSKRPDKKAKKGDLETLNVKDVLDEDGFLKVEGMANLHEINPKIAKKMRKISDDVQVERKGHFIVIKQNNVVDVTGGTGSDRTEDKKGGFPF